MKRVTVFGATGSIGQNTLDLIARAPDNYDVVALTGGRNVQQLARDARAVRAYSRAGFRPIPQLERRPGDVLIMQYHTNAHGPR